MKIPYKKCLPLSTQYFHSQFDLTLIIRTADLVSSSIWHFFTSKRFSISYYTILSLRFHHKIIYMANFIFKRYFFPFLEKEKVMTICICLKNASGITPLTPYKYYLFFFCYYLLITFGSSVNE